MPPLRWLPTVTERHPRPTADSQDQEGHTSCTSGDLFRRDEYAAPMARRSSGRHEALPGRDQPRGERSGQQRPEPHESSESPPAPTADDRRRAAATCGWCGQKLELKARGRLPKWCSVSCRQRAWEQARAAASGLAAVRVVERPVEVRVPATPTRRDWAQLLHELARQIDDGRVYDRDLHDLSAALREVHQAFDRRLFVRDRRAAGRPI